MIEIIWPIVMAILEIFQSHKTQVASSTGLSEDAVSKVGDAVQGLLGQNTQALQAAYAEIDSQIEKAREHDTAMDAKMPPVVELLRGLVRPVITLTAFFWYVYARAVGITMGSEDYAIVGGIMAFWFGFRPFEKTASSGSAGLSLKSVTSSLGTGVSTLVPGNSL